MTPPAAVNSPVMTTTTINEIDFCLSNLDSSLSLAASDRPSMTSFLNVATNRALRRIILARSWPSEEKLSELLNSDEDGDEQAAGGKSGKKCPVPRPILKLIMLGRSSPPPPQESCNQQIISRLLPSDNLPIAAQLNSFEEIYNGLPNFKSARAYYETVLSLSHEKTFSDVDFSPLLVESFRDDPIFSKSYDKFVRVLADAGVSFAVGDPSSLSPRLFEKDFCLSLFDKINFEREQRLERESELAQKRVGVFGGIAGLEDSLQIEDSPSKLDREKNDDVGDVLLSTARSSATAALNTLSNVVYRSVLFGGRGELILLRETLLEEMPMFRSRWKNEDAFQYLSALAMLLETCIEEEVVTSLQPPVKLSVGFTNSYDRLLKLLLENGSGYVRPLMDDDNSGFLESFSSFPSPKTPTEELDRFTYWESRLRNKNNKNNNAYPNELVGEWLVEDEVAGATLGVTSVTFEAGGDVKIKNDGRANGRVEGLRWRLDAGPTHMDTATFQVRGSDGLVFMYKGFLDRGARLESRISGRSISIKGTVSWQLPKGYRENFYTSDYNNDIRPLVAEETMYTRFIMRKQQKTAEQ